MRPVTTVETLAQFKLSPNAASMAVAVGGIAASRCDAEQAYARRMRASSSTVRSAVGFASKRPSGMAVPLSIEIP